jgi:zinc protease
MAAAVLAVWAATPDRAAFAQTPPPPSAQARAAWGFDRSDLTPDPAVRFGVLGNGMRYAILRNRVPPGAVAIRLYVAVGATAGAPGEAHYLEHLAFMGSRHMPEGALAWLTGRERLRLDSDFNAHTTDTYTYYRVDLRRADRGRIERMLGLMREIASELSLTPEGMARAREGLLGEARQRLDPDPRRNRDQIAFFAPDTAIARASLTGTESDVAAIQADGLRRFYDQYYAPGRATLIVVGDADPAWIEARIAARFADWRARDPAPDPPPGRIDPARPTAFRFLHTPFGPTWATIASVTPLGQAGDAAAPRDRGFLEALGADMLAARVLGHRGGDRPFMDAEAAVEDYYRTARVARFAVRAIDGDWRLALEVAEQELRRALLHGFTQAELDIELGREAERLANFAPPQASTALAERTVALIGAGVVVTAPASPADSAAYLARIRLDAVNAGFRAAWAAPGRLIHVSHDRAIEGGEARLAEVWAASAARPVAPQ